MGRSSASRDTRGSASLPSPPALKAAQRMKRSQGESFESREVTYRRLLELAENGDINQLVDGFIEKEGKNFAYFSYATELNSEMEKLQQRIKNLQVCCSPAPRLSIATAENTSGWGCFFPSSMCPAFLPTPGPGLQPTLEESKGQLKIQLPDAERCRLKAKSVPMLPPCFQQKYCTRRSSRRLKSCLGSVRSWLEQGMLPVEERSPGAISRGVPSPRARGWTPGSAVHICWTGSHCPLHVLLFAQNEIALFTTDQENTESSSLHVLKELEVGWLGFPPAEIAGADLP